MPRKPRRGRAPNGEGSIHTRKDGRVQASVMVGYKAGKDGQPVPQRLTAYGATAQEARARLAEKVRRHREGQPVTEGTQSVAQYLDYWLENVIEPSHRVRTFEQYAWAVHRHLAPAFGHLPLEKFRAQHLQSLLTGMSRRYSPATCQAVRTVMVIALNQAEKWRLVSRNEAELTGPPARTRTEPAAWSAEQARTFLAAIEGHPYRGPWLLMLTMGLRRGEALGLRWECVDLERGVLSVRWSLGYSMRDGLTLSEPKRGRIRDMALPEVCAAMLRAQWAAQWDMRAEAASWRDDLNLVFTDEEGGPLSGHRVLQALYAVEAAAGLPRMTLHHLRHTFASMLSEEGLDIQAIKSAMGHSDIATTSRYYLRSGEGSRKRVADTMSRVIADTSEGHGV